MKIPASWLRASCCWRSTRCGLATCQSSSPSSSSGKLAQALANFKLDHLPSNLANNTFIVEEIQRANIFYLTYTQNLGLLGPKPTIASFLLLLIYAKIVSILYVFLFMSCFPLSLCFCRRLSHCLCLCLSFKDEAMKSDIVPILCPVCVSSFVIVFCLSLSSTDSTKKIIDRPVKINPLEFFVS